MRKLGRNKTSGDLAQDGIRSWLRGKNTCWICFCYHCRHVYVTVHCHYYCATSHRILLETCIFFKCFQFHVTRRYMALIGIISQLMGVIAQKAPQSRVNFRISPAIDQFPPLSLSLFIYIYKYTSPFIYPVRFAFAASTCFDSRGAHDLPGVSGQGGPGKLMMIGGFWPSSPRGDPYSL